MSVVKLIHKALSDSDIRRILGSGAKIFKYSELANFESLEQLLPNAVDYCIILYEDGPNHGHWVGLSKYGNTFEHFDSYGIKPDKELAWINFKTRRYLQENAPYLTQLLRGEHYVYNNVRFQAMDSNVNTCGSHVVHRLYRLKNENMDLKSYQKFMLKIKDEYNMGYDLIVAEFISKFFK